jgi:hypothetical protein
VEVSEWQGKNPPDLTKDFVDWLGANYPLPVWDGHKASRAEYLRDVGRWELVGQLRDFYNDTAGLEPDAESAR